MRIALVLAAAALLSACAATPDHAPPTPDDAPPPESCALYRVRLSADLPSPLRDATTWALARWSRALAGAFPHEIDTNAPTRADARGRLEAGIVSSHSLLCTNS